MPTAGQGSENGLAQMMSAMNQLLDQNRLQMAEMKSMRVEIATLRDKCDAMEKSLQSAMDSRFNDVDNKLQYHEVLLKNQKWDYSATSYPDVSESRSFP